MPPGTDVTYTTLPNREKKQPAPRGKRKLLMVTMKQLKKKQSGNVPPKKRR